MYQLCVSGSSFRYGRDLSIEQTGDPGAQACQQMRDRIDERGQQIIDLVQITEDEQAVDERQERHQELTAAFRLLQIRLPVAVHKEDKGKKRQEVASIT